MKFLWIVCGLALALCGVIVSCGPQKPYCPSSSTGQCLDNSGNGGQGGDTVDSGGPGDAVIISGDDTGP